MFPPYVDMSVYFEEDLTSEQRASQIVSMVVAMRGMFADGYSDLVPKKLVKAVLNEHLPDIILELRRLREQINGRDWRRVK